MNNFEQPLTDIHELEILSKTRQILKFRLAFATICLLFDLVFAALIIAEKRAITEFDFPLVTAIIIAVILYSSLAMIFVRHTTLKVIAHGSRDEKVSLSATRESEKNQLVLNAILLALDVIALTALVHATRGIESDLYILYLLPILLSSYVLTRLGIYVISLFVSLSYIGLLLIENYHPIILLGESIRTQVGGSEVIQSYLNSIWRRILLRSLIFTGVAFIWGGFCSYMARFAQSMTNRLRSQLRNNQQLMDEMKDVESHLIHQEKMASLGRLVAGIAHEINNPINFVHGNLPYLKNYCEDMKKLIAAADSFPEPEKLAVQELKSKIKYDFLVTDLDNILADMEEGVERIRQIVKNLRSFGRVDEAELKEASINEGIESTLKILGQYYGRDKIPVQLDLQEIPPVLCYPGQLNQVWMNLLSNAAQALEQVNEPAVKVKTELDEQNILVSVFDNGPGIEEANQSKVFEPFFTTKPVGKGTGLGLSICHSIIERHQGRIWFEKNGNGGTVFKVSIPRQIQLSQA